MTCVILLIGGFWLVWYGVYFVFYWWVIACGLFVLLVGLVYVGLWFYVLWCFVFVLLNLTLFG